MSTVRTMFETGASTCDPRREVEKYYGKYPGLVFENTAPDGEAHRGELVVDVPGILEETPDGSGQRPIRVVAKPCFPSGFFFVPEAGAQVWVEFVAGDINFPIWTGAWYPEGAVPQTTDGEGPTEFQKVIRTASGHVMELDDDDSKIVILDSNGNRATLDDQGITITDKADNQIIMDSSGVRVVDKSSNEIIMASGGVTVKSNAIKLGSDMAVEPLVLGNQWMQLFNMHVHIGNMGAPTSPPAAAGTPATPAHLSAKHKTE